MSVLLLMSTELDQAREIAERIARRVSSERGSTATPSQPKAEVGAELAAVRAGLSELQRKIAQLEAKVISEPSGTSTPIQRSGDSNRYPAPVQQKPVLITHSPWLAGINASYSHPSQEKFGVEEATVSELVDFFEKEKMCSLEAGKPCDHCDMCSSRGF
jgi:hypothetical protein